MHLYHHVMLVTETLPLPKQILTRVKKMTCRTDARLTILHTLPKLATGIEYVLPSLGEADRIRMTKAKKQLAEVRDMLGVKECHCKLAIGCNMLREISQAAYQENIDLIIVHFKRTHWIKSIIKKVNCDILDI